MRSAGSSALPGRTASALHRILGRPGRRGRAAGDLLAAWRGLAQFEGRSLGPTWLYRVAPTAASGAALGEQAAAGDWPHRGGRTQAQPGGRGDLAAALTPTCCWKGSPTPPPAPRPDMRPANHLAGLRHRPADPATPQRAVLILRDVLGFPTSRSPASWTAAGPARQRAQRAAPLCAASSTPAAARRRPRAGLPRGTGPGRPVHPRLPGGDVADVVALLPRNRRDMPPLSLEYHGRELGRSGSSPPRLAPAAAPPHPETRANGQPAFGCTPQIRGRDLPRGRAVASPSPATYLRH